MGSVACPDPGTTITPTFVSTITPTVVSATGSSSQYDWTVLSSAGPEDGTTIFSTAAPATASTTASPSSYNLHWVDAGILVAIAVVGLVANTAVFVVVCFSRRFKNDFIFFVNLAVADFLVCPVLFFLAWWLIKPLDGDCFELCTAAAAFEWLIGCSTLSMASIAIKRDIFIKRTVVELRLLRNEGFRITLGLALWIAVTWVYPGIVVAVPFFVDAEQFCAVVFLLGLYANGEVVSDPDYLQGMLYVVLVIGVPLVIILMCSCRSLYRVWTELASRGGWYSRGEDADDTRRLLSSNVHSSLADNKLRKVARVILASCVGFLILFLPHLVTVIYRGTSPIVTLQMTVLMASSCCMNPFIYAFTVRDFRRTLESVCRCHWGRVTQPRFAYIQRRRDYEILRETDNVRSIVVSGGYNYDEDDDDIQVF